jgi:hypothetical protein
VHPWKPAAAADESKTVGPDHADREAQLDDLLDLFWDFLLLDFYGGRPPLRDDRMDVLKEFR